MNRNKEEPLTAATLNSMLDKRFKLVLDALDDKLKPLQALDSVVADIEAIKKTVKEQGEESEGLQRYQRRNCTVVYGIPQRKGEGTIRLAVALGRDMGVDVQPRDIDNVHRLRSRAADPSNPSAPLLPSSSSG